MWERKCKKRVCVCMCRQQRTENLTEVCYGEEEEVCEEKQKKKQKECVRVCGSAGV